MNGHRDGPMKTTARSSCAVFVLSLALRSVLLAVLLASAYLRQPYDTSNLITARDCDAALSQPPGDHVPPNSLSRVAVWDSVFFVRVAQCGYEYEQFHAFFPLLPTLLRLLNFNGLAGSLPAGNVPDIVLGGLLLSTLASAAASVLLFRLTQKLYMDDQLAALSAILFSCNPASVFFSAVYSESVFALLMFSALSSLAQRPLYAAALFGLSTAARSNGIVSGIFVGHDGLQRLQKLHMRTFSGKVRIILQTAAGGLLVALLLLGFQWHGYRAFCHGPPLQQPAWCSATLPYLYGHVQAQYWGVGFLRYFQLQQVPNFLLAAPMLGLSLWGCYTFVVEHGVQSSLAALLTPGKPVQMRKQQRTTFPLAAAVYIAHWGFLAAFAMVGMHVQVATRLLSTCPPLYWFAAQLCYRRRRYAQLVWLYFMGYAALGYVLFPQFLPWT